MNVLSTLSMFMMSKIPYNDKPGKSDGIDHLFLMYFLYLFTTVLYYWFKFLMYFHYTPKSYKQRYIWCKNYRGIALSSLFFNVFDSCIISLNS